MLLASDGDENAARSFYSLYLTHNFIVPERYQDYQLNHVPSYPNDFVNVLGVQSDSRVIVPAFTDLALLKDWCHQELRYKELTGSKLLELMPADWWICINPGDEVEKE